MRPVVGGGGVIPVSPAAQGIIGVVGTATIRGVEGLGIPLRARAKTADPDSGGLSLRAGGLGSRALVLQGW